MTTLDSTLIDNSMPMWLLIVLILFFVFMAFTMFDSQISSIIASVIAIIALSSIYVYFENDLYEERKVLVDDWNIIHEEGWQVVSIEGKIVVIKKYIK